METARTYKESRIYIFINQRNSKVLFEILEDGRVVGYYCTSVDRTGKDAGTLKPLAGYKKDEIISWIVKFDSSFGSFSGQTSALFNNIDTLWTVQSKPKGDTDFATRITGSDQFKRWTNGISQNQIINHHYQTTSSTMTLAADFRLEDIPQETVLLFSADEQTAGIG